MCFRAPKEIVERLYLMHGTLKFWGETRDEFQLCSARSDAQQALRDWDEWLGARAEGSNSPKSARRR